MQKNVLTKGKGISHPSYFQVDIDRKSNSSTRVEEGFTIQQTIKGESLMGISYQHLAKIIPI